MITINNLEKAIALKNQLRCLQHFKRDRVRDSPNTTCQAYFRLSEVSGSCRNSAECQYFLDKEDLKLLDPVFDLLINKAEKKLKGLGVKL